MPPALPPPPFPGRVVALALALALAAAGAASPAAAKVMVAPPPCPDAVLAAGARAFPGSTPGRCRAAREDGRDFFELRLTRKDGSPVELDVAADGAVLELEEPIAPAALPAAVARAFAARYPKAALARAERQTITGKGVFYELAFARGKRRGEATFAADGAFVEEE